MQYPEDVVNLFDTVMVRGSKYAYIKSPEKLRVGLAGPCQRWSAQRADISHSFWLTKCFTAIDPGSLDWDPCRGHCTICYQGIVSQLQGNWRCLEIGFRQAKPWAT